MFVILNRVAEKKDFEPMGLIRVNPRHVVAYGPYVTNKFATDDAEVLDSQGNIVTEIVLSTGHVLFVAETPSELDRLLGRNG